MRYFIDTNLIIDFLDKEKQDAIDKLTPILEDAESEIFINRLVYVETLRTVKLNHLKNFQKLKIGLEGFEILDINQTIYDQAISLSRYCQSKGKTISGRCAAIDLLHFSTAKYYELELLAKDGDMDMLIAIYPDWLEYMATADEKMSLNK